MARKTHRGEKARLRADMQTAQEAAGFEQPSLELGSISTQLRSKFRKKHRDVFSEGCKVPDGELLKVGSGVSLALISEGLTIFQNIAAARAAYIDAAESGDQAAAAAADLRLESHKAMMIEHARLSRSLRPLVGVIAKLVDVQAKLHADEVVGELALKAFDGREFDATFDAEKIH